MQKHTWLALVFGSFVLPPVLIVGLVSSGCTYGRVEIRGAGTTQRNDAAQTLDPPSAKLDPIARHGGHVLTQTTMPRPRRAAYLWAKNIGTLVAYEAFLRRYPDGDDAQFLRAQIRKRFIPQEEGWHEAWLLYSRMDLIEGAICDPEEGFILLARPGKSRLPPFLYEDLIAALRCAISGEKVGVTMNRVFSARFAQPDDPRKAPYEVYETSVSFFSRKLWNTHLGAVLFEGDRTLKTVSSGYDIFSHEGVVCRVPGFRTIAEMEAARPPRSDEAGAGQYGRIWIELAGVQVNTTKKRNVAILSHVKLNVRSESNHSPPIRIARHLQENYHAYGEEFPIFAEVERAARVVSIAHWLVETYPDIAQKIIAGSHENVKVFVPQVIPAHADLVQSMPHCKRWLVGGIAFPNVNKTTIIPTARVGDTALDDVQSRVAASRPGTAPAWEVPFGKQQDQKWVAWNVSGMSPQRRDP